MRIIKAGIFDTFQDKGRLGFAKWGINTNGAMDKFAMTAANALAGNEPDTPVLEMHFPAPEILFKENALISVTGADFNLVINGVSVPVWKSMEVAAGSILKFIRRQNGMRCYLSVHGGFEIGAWLGSASTNLKARSGGFEGRRLKKDDEFQIICGRFSSAIASTNTVFPWTVNTTQVYNEREKVKVIPGNEWDCLTSQSRENFFALPLAIDPSSDRMASFLVHDNLAFDRNEQLLSSAVTFGTVQALPSGKLCVLMADHQTTGGYPRVACIVSAHLPRFAQIAPNEKFAFERTSVEEAEKMLLSLEMSSIAMKNALHENLQQYYGIH
jgi:antagonist of KipI